MTKKKKIIAVYIKFFIDVKPNTHSPFIAFDRGDHCDEPDWPGVIRTGKLLRGPMAVKAPTVLAAGAVFSFTINRHEYNDHERAYK